MEEQRKKTISPLMNIDSFTGEHEGRLGPSLLFVCVACIPLILYFMFNRFINFYVYIIFQILFAIRMALFILGQENKKLKIYLESRVDAYSTTKDLVETAFIREDGLIEYVNGTVAYILEVYTNSYLDDDVLSLDIEQFLDLFNRYTPDLYFLNVVGEHSLTDNIGHIVAKDKLGEERFEFLQKQDEFCDTHSKLYKVAVVLKCNRSDWKTLETDIKLVLNSNKTKVFRHIKLCDRDDVIAIIRRDLCAYVDIDEMILSKYSNEEFLGSRVLYYDTPEEIKNMNKEDVGLNKRRVVR